MHNSWSIYPFTRSAATCGVTDDHSAQSEQDALQIDHQLADFRKSFAEKITLARKQLPLGLEENERLNFETGIELLQRLSAELHDYTKTYTSFSGLQSQTGTQGFSEPPVKSATYIDPLVVAIAGIRGALALAILSTIWILTDWGSGVEAITIGVVTSTLFATAPSPTNTLKKFMTGAVIGTVFGYICNFYWLTHAHGFEMLALAVSPPLIFAAYLTTRPSTAPIGSATFIVFLMHIGFNSGYNADPGAFFNDAIADLLAVLISATMYELIDLSSSRWSRLRISKALQQLVIACCSEPIILRRSQLENSARDLAQRAGSIQRTGEKENRMVIQWLLSVLEIGHAIITLRENLQGIEDPSLAKPMQAVLDAIVNLYKSPKAAQRLAAIKAIDRAMIALDMELASLMLTYSKRHQITIMLHFIRSALLDEESVLAVTHTPLREAH